MVAKTSGLYAADGSTYVTLTDGLGNSSSVGSGGLDIPSTSVTAAGPIYTINDTSGLNAASIQVVSAGTTCTITYEGSEDGTTWFAVAGYDSSAIGSSSALTTSTNTGLRWFPLNAKMFRARVSTYTSGTVTIKGFASPAPLSRHELRVSTFGGTSTAADAVATTTTASAVVANNLVYNGSTWDRRRSIGSGASQTVTTGMAASTAVPHGTAVAGIPNTANTAAGSSLVLKAAAGNLFSISVNATAAGFLMVFDATAAPADGAVTPVFTAVVPANGMFFTDFAYPIRCATGITLVYSSTGPFSKTASATAFLSGQFI